MASPSPTNSSVSLPAGTEKAFRWPPARAALGWLTLAGVLAWSYWEPMLMLAGRWWREPDYLHGFLVPVFAGYLLYARRERFAPQAIRGSWWGVMLFAMAGAMRWAAAYYYVALLEPLSLLPCLAGVALFVGGWRTLRWTGPSIAFLVFMVPLPGFVAGALSHPLQRIGTIVSTYLLQTLSVPCVAQGNVIVLNEVQLGVVEACSGLRMMWLFLAVCTGAAIYGQRPLLDRVVIVLSAAPIALLANVFRITFTGLLHEFASHSLAEQLYHDFAGWLMMPVAVLLLWAEIGLLARLLLPPIPDGPMSMNVGQASRAAATKARRRRCQ